MKRRALLKAAAWGAVPFGSVAADAPDRNAAGPKTFRWAFVAAETGFDPAQISDLYSNYVVANIFEAPLQYDYLARPAKIKPRTAAGDA